MDDDDDGSGDDGGSDNPSDTGSSITSSGLAGTVSAVDSVLPDQYSSYLDSGIALAQQAGILPQTSQTPAQSEVPTPAAATTAGISTTTWVIIAVAGGLGLWLLFK